MDAQRNINTKGEINQIISTHRSQQYNSESSQRSIKIKDFDQKRAEILQKRELLKKKKKIFKQENFKIQKAINESELNQIESETAKIKEEIIVEGDLKNQNQDRSKIADQLCKQKLSYYMEELKQDFETFFETAKASKTLTLQIKKAVIELAGLKNFKLPQMDVHNKIRLPESKS